MILVGNQRGGAKDLALHLMKDENEHVEVFEVRGFGADSLLGALKEAYAVSQGTRCKQFLYSLSLNPPPGARVNTPDFLDAIDRIEESLGLNDQPRAIVFHEKEGRRHAHAVWSRINTDEMKAVQLSFTKNRLQTISRELFLEHGWRMPRGLANSEKRDPRNFTLAQWQQAKRIGKDPRAIKTAIQDAWAISDSKAAFAHALEERGYRLARGDRRGFVVVDFRGEVYSIPKWAGVKTKQVRDRLGPEDALPSVTDAKARVAEDMLGTVDRLACELEAETKRQEAEFQHRHTVLVQRQRTDRQNLQTIQEQRGIAEAKARQARFRTGIKGLWDRLRGQHARIAKENEREAEAAQIRDRQERDALIFRHQVERRRIRRIGDELHAEFDRNEQELEDARRSYRELQEMPENADTPRRRRMRRPGP